MSKFQYIVLSSRQFHFDKVSTDMDRFNFSDLFCKKNITENTKIHFVITDFSRLASLTTNEEYQEKNYTNIGLVFAVIKNLSQTAGNGYLITLFPKFCKPLDAQQK